MARSMDRKNNRPSLAELSRIDAGAVSDPVLLSLLRLAQEHEVLRAAPAAWPADRLAAAGDRSASSAPRREGPRGAGTGGEKVWEIFFVLLDQPGLTLAQTSRFVGTSARTLQRRLEESGTNFQEISRLARVTCAGRLLLEEDDTITNVALRTGFSDAAHLSREFRSFVGLAPNQFRAALR